MEEYIKVTQRHWCPQCGVYTETDAEHAFRRHTIDGILSSVDWESLYRDDAETPDIWLRD